MNDFRDENDRTSDPGFDPKLAEALHELPQEIEPERDLLRPPRPHRGASLCPPEPSCRPRRGAPPGGRRRLAHAER